MSKETESRALTIVLFLHKMLRGAKTDHQHNFKMFPMAEVTSEEKQQAPNF